MPAVIPFSQKLRGFIAFIGRHVEALTFVLTVILPSIVRNRRRPVMFSRHSGMGDIVCTIPAARMLKDRHRGAVFFYNCYREFSIIPRIAGVADRISSVKAIGQVGYYYHFFFEGFYHFGHGDDFPDRGCQEPMVAEFCRQFDLPVVEEHPSLHINEDALRNVLVLMAKKGLERDQLILIHPGPSWTVREWPQEKWNRLVDELRRRGFVNIAQLGVSRHLNFGDVSVPDVVGATSFIDALSIEECMAIISQATLFIGIDSGLLHFAACSRTPAVGIFGMTLPEFRFSRQFRAPFVVNRIACAGCEHRKPRLHWITGCPYDIRCMQTLDVDEVLRACLLEVARDPDPTEEQSRPALP